MPRPYPGATLSRLVEVGYVNLNVRDMTSEAGAHHALIGAHFLDSGKPLVGSSVNSEMSIIEPMTAS